MNDRSIKNKLTKTINPWPLKSIYVVMISCFVVSVAFVSGLFLADKIFWQEASEFSTNVSQAKKASEFTFAVVGDIATSKNSTATLETITKAKPDFTLIAGDLSYGQTKTEVEWCNYVKKTLGETHPVEIVAGNHDVEDPRYTKKQGQISQFAACLPNRMADILGVYGEQYAFVYKNLAKYIAISPGLTINDVTYTYKDNDNRRWLETQIKDAKDKGLWTIVMMHKNCITIGDKSCEITEDLQDYLVRAGVDLVLQGHEHAYMRSKQLHMNDDCKTISLNPANKNCIKENVSNFEFSSGGTVIVINGLGGHSMYDLNLNKPEKEYLAIWYGKNINNSEFGPSLFTVNKDSIKGILLTNRGKQADVFTITR